MRLYVNYKPMNRQQLAAQLRDHPDRTFRRIRLRGINASGLDFSDRDLTGADLSFSNLHHARFDSAILTGANLSFSNLHGATFANADLRDINLSFSTLSGVDLSQANLEGASLSFTNISQRTFHKPPPPGPITLISLLKKPVWGVLIGSLLGALLVYGSSGIIYFTNLILHAKNPLIAQLNHFIAVQNVAEGIAVFLTAWSISNWLDRRLRLIWVRHLVYTLYTLPFLFAISVGTYHVLGKWVIEAIQKLPPAYTSDYMSDSAPWQLYLLADLIIGNVFLYALRQGKQLTRKMGEQEFALLNMEKLKTRAELDALQAKINPHFLYNALNSIASLVHENPDQAEEMTMLLSKLFRYTTGRDGELFTTLANELEMVRTYLRVEQVRFGERLRVRVEMTDTELGELRLPQFLLQPLVENAIKHGISQLAGDGLIEVLIYEKQGWLHLCIHDNGPAFPEPMSGGYGLRSIQEKLRLLYADDARLTIQNEPQKQVTIQIAIAKLSATPRHEQTLKNHLG